jgi:hypothetical protein
MTLIWSGRVRAALVTSLALVLSMLPTAGSHAYTSDEEQACTGDAFRLCSSEIPDVDRITACMIRNKSQLSPECRVYFRQEPEQATAAPAAPLDLRPAKRKTVSTRPAKARKLAKRNAT